MNGAGGAVCMYCSVVPSVVVMLHMQIQLMYHSILTSSRWQQMSGVPCHLVSSSWPRVSHHQLREWRKPATTLMCQRWKAGCECAGVSLLMSPFVEWPHKVIKLFSELHVLLIKCLIYGICPYRGWGVGGDILWHRPVWINTLGPGSLTAKVWLNLQLDRSIWLGNIRAKHHCGAGRNALREL